MARLRFERETRTPPGPRHLRSLHSRQVSKRRVRRQAVLFMVAMASLLFLCMLHFVQFQRYQALQDL